MQDQGDDSEVGQVLSVDLLRIAYANGFFPMPDPKDDNRILWYKPDPRAIIPLNDFHCSRSLRKVIRQEKFSVTFDKQFREVMLGCADRHDTWINAQFLDIYTKMFEAGHAHSVEVWSEDKLSGGLYGVSIGGAFFAESKFHRERDASKVALYHLVEHLRRKKFLLLEIQFLTPHLQSLGAIEISDADYSKLLKLAIISGARF